MRKERDFHKTHQDRVNSEKVTIAQNIKKMKDLHEDYEEKIEEIQKKHLTAVKEKAFDIGRPNRSQPNPHLLFREGDSNSAPPTSAIILRWPS